MANEELSGQIYSTLNPKETDELLNIWKTNNRSEWSDEVFAMIKEILQGRGVEIPQQGQPMFNKDKESLALDDDIVDDDYDLNQSGNNTNDDDDGTWGGWDDFDDMMMDEEGDDYI
jgi:hypothetical protein